MDGVAAVYTGADLVADNIGTIPTLPIFKRPDGSPMQAPPRRLLAHEVVRFAGEPVAAVLAARAPTRRPQPRPLPSITKFCRP
jgi:carbon-monoxide dehydrogenase large subunit